MIPAAYVSSNTPLLTRMSFLTSDGYFAVTIKLNIAPHKYPIRITGGLHCVVRTFLNSVTCPFSVGSVWNGSILPCDWESASATGAISPAIPGPPWMTATVKGALPHVLQFFISAMNFWIVQGINLSYRWYKFLELFQDL